MIRPIDIRLNAAHPDYPLAEAVTFTGSPSTVLIRGVPPNCGRWAITAVSVAATYPDGSTTTRAAVQSANGVWVATLPATATSGRTANGLRVIADGIDENGEAVTGYILGVADFAVASLAVTPAPQPGETSWQMLYFDEVPSTLRKGDVTKVDGVLKLYNGTAWEPFAGDIPAPSTATPAMDGAGAAGTSAAYARGDHVHPSDTSRVPTSRTVNGKALSSDVTLTGADIAVSGTDATKIDAALAGKASKADATLTPIYSDTPTFSEWVFSPEQVTDPGGGVHGLNVSFDSNSSRWLLRFSDGSYNINSVVGTLYDTSLQFPSSDYIPQQKVTATRTRTDIIGYQLGSQSDKPLASEAEAEALRQGKQNALTAQQLANIAAVPDKADETTPVVNPPSLPADCFPVVYEDPSGTYTAYSNAELVFLNPGPDNYIMMVQDYAGGGWIFDKTQGKYRGTYDPSGTVTFAGQAPVVDSWPIINLSAKGGAVVRSADIAGLADRAAHPTAGNLAALDASGNPTDAGWTAGELARYSLVTKTINNGAVTLDDRAINAVAVSSSLTSLTINFPTATTGKVRDFAMRLNIAAGVTAPEIAWPQGVTLENNGGEMPEIADGGTGGSSTVLYFSETENNGTTAKFLVKGETLTAIAQA